MPENYWKELANERNGRKAAEAANAVLRTEIEGLKARIRLLEATIAGYEAEEKDISELPDIEAAENEKVPSDPD